MSTLPGRPARSRPSLFALLTGAVFAAGGLVAVAALLFQCRSWWSERSYVPVQAQVLKTTLNTHTRKSSTSYRIGAHYAYEFQGRQYTGNKLGASRNSVNTYNRLTAAHAARSTVTVWVDPDKPASATLNRSLHWTLALALLLLAAMFTTTGIGILTLPFSVLREPARGPLIAADHGTYLFAAPLAFLWNLMAFPLAAVALAGLVQEPRWPHLLAFLFLAGALLLAAKAWRLYERRWLLGVPVLERLEVGSRRFKARIHFHPALGLRVAQDGRSHRIGVGIRQVQHVTSMKKTRAETIWQQDLGDNDVAHGTAMIEIEVDVPPWRHATSRARPACWEVTVRALGTQAEFRLAPSLLK